jgi:hypothetical protein
MQTFHCGMVRKSRIDQEFLCIFNGFRKSLRQGRGDGNNTTWHCDMCPTNKCIHVWAAIVIASVHLSTPIHSNPIDPNELGL